MAGYKQVTPTDADIFMKLYRKYLQILADNMEYTLRNLPYDVINRAFDGKKFYEDGYDVEKIESAEFGFDGLSGYMVVREVASTLDYLSNAMQTGNLVEMMARVGHKVNSKKVGIPGWKE